MFGCINLPMLKIECCHSKYVNWGCEFQCVCVGACLCVRECVLVWIHQYLHEFVFVFVKEKERERECMYLCVCIGM